jgi:hypothetical protein
MDDLVREAGRRRHRVQQRHPIAIVSRLLAQLPRGRFRRILAAVELPRRNFHLQPLEGFAVLLDDEQLPVDDGDDRHRPRMLDDFPRRRAAVRQRHLVDLQRDDLALEDLLGRDRLFREIQILFIHFYILPVISVPIRA